MKNLSFLGCVINIILYIVYVLVVSVIFSFIFPMILSLLGKWVLDPTDPVFAKIQIAIALLVLIVSLVARKYFYKPLFTEKQTTKVAVEDKKSYTKTVKEKAEKQKGKMKIYVDKEIK